MKKEIIKHDLNIGETMTDQWEVSDALRELISNAIDESILSNTKKPKWSFKNNIVTIEDFGRGIISDNFINDENKEKKQRSDEVIGVFGVGLKDALNVLYNKGKKLEILSNNKRFTLTKDTKPNTNSETLFVLEEEVGKAFKGTKIIVSDIDKLDYDKTLKMFLINNNHRKLWETKNGNIYDGEEKGKIYLKGVLIAETNEYHYSYNITKPLKSLINKLGRERKNIGKTAYSDTVKSIYSKLKKEDFLEWFKPFTRLSGSEVQTEIQSKPAQNLFSNYGGKLISQTYFDSLENSERNKLIEDGYITTPTKGFVLSLPTEIKNKRHWDELSKTEKQIINNWLSFCKKHKLPSISASKIYLASDIISRGRTALGVCCDYQYIVLDEKILKNDIGGIKTLVHECTHYIYKVGDETREFQHALEENFSILLKEIFKK